MKGCLLYTSLDLERRGDGRVEHLGVVGQDLDLAGRELGVGGLLATGAHDAVDLKMMKKQ